MPPVPFDSYSQFIICRVGCKQESLVIAVFIRKEEVSTAAVSHPGGTRAILFRNGAFQVICMAVSSLDILNLSHSFKDVCEAHAKSPECLSCTLRLLLEYNLIQANLEYSRRFCCTPQAPDDAASKNCKKEFPSAES